MELQDNILKAFADSINASDTSESGIRTFYGKVVRKDGDNVFVRLNGADETVETPVVSTVEVGVNDIVMISIKNHTATIIGNISWPATTRVGALYVTLTSEGLVVGQLDPATNNPTGYYMLVSSTDIQLRSVDGTALARFGSTVVLGKTNNQIHTEISPTGMTVYNASGVPLVSIGATTSRDSYGTTIDGLYTVGSMYAEGGPVSVGNRNKRTKLDMIATPMSHVGLRANNDSWLLLLNNSNGNVYVGGDSNNQNWLLSRDAASGNVFIGGYNIAAFVVGADQKQLWTGNLYPPDPNSGISGGSMTSWIDSNGYLCETVSSITEWYTILLRVRCGDEYTSIVCCRAAGSSVEYHHSDPAYTYGGTAYVVKAGYKIGWSDGYIAVKRIAGPTASGSEVCCAIVGVYGLIRGARTSGSSPSGGPID